MAVIKSIIFMYYLPTATNGNAPLLMSAVEVHIYVHCCVTIIIIERNMTFLPAPILLRAICVGEECVPLCDSNANGKNRVRKKKIFSLWLLCKRRVQHRRCWHRNGKKKTHHIRIRRMVYGVRISTSRARSHSSYITQTNIYFSLIFVFASQTNKFLPCLFYGYCLLPILLLLLSISGAYIIVI